MAGEWRESTWGDLATLEYGKGLREYGSSVGHYRVFGTNGPIGWHSEPLCNYPTVIVGRKGAYRGIHFSPEPCFLIDTAFYLAPKTDFDMRWAYYQLLTQDINSMDSGSAIPSTSREDFYRLSIRLPPLSEQRAIAHILGTLDDKIELNRRMNETLEAMAQALFKSWFIDPVADGLPKGWRMGTLGDIADNPRRGVDPAEIEPSTPYVGLEHMPRRSIALSDWGQADELESNKFEFENGEILFGKLRPYFHKVGVAPVGGVCSTDILVVVPKDRDWFGFVLGHVSSEDFVNFAAATSTGTRMPRTNWQDMAHYEVAIPPEPIAKDFTKICQPMIDRIIANIHESRTLAALRDTLLPKLLSGEIRLTSFIRRV